MRVLFLQNNKLRFLFCLVFLFIGIYIGAPFCMATLDSTYTTFVATKEISPQNSISNYLANIHAEIIALRKSEKLPTKTLHIVLGNQSADMDSIVSAITFAYANAEKGCYIPIINIPRDELLLREDVLHVFEILKIDSHSLLYQEDLSFLQKLAKQGCVLVTLVDHNRLAPDQEIFAEYVERIIDHHKEEKIHYPLMKESEKLIATTGSNSTLIAEQVLLNSDSCSPQTACLLLSAILLDTRNLNNKGVTSEKDIAIASVLKEKAEEYYSNAFYDDLIKMRNSVEHLTPDLLLKKDYKLYKEGKFHYGIASIPEGVSWIPENRAQWKEAFVQSLERQQIHLLSALAHDRNNRIYIVYMPSLRLQESFLVHIQQIAILSDELILKLHFPEEGLFFFVLKKPLSRKQLQPLLSFEKSVVIQNAIP